MQKSICPHCRFIITQKSLFRSSQETEKSLLSPLCILPVSSCTHLSLHLREGHTYTHALSQELFLILTTKSKESLEKKSLSKCGRRAIRSNYIHLFIASSHSCNDHKIIFRPLLFFLPQVEQI